MEDDFEPFCFDDKKKGQQQNAMFLQVGSLFHPTSRKIIEVEWRVGRGAVWHELERVGAFETQAHVKFMGISDIAIHFSMSTQLK